ncbi:SDR family NAD(P)-dependent oxidoreductase [Kitasatospora sp. McL0602]|uniref:SDR family NAD(P)-dependent oxidoreductase n=1 Tax=Kitasatospora sp. McL0602 TaxID=3439530 RepID=UPI003F8C55B9
MSPDPSSRTIVVSGGRLPEGEAVTRHLAAAGAHVVRASTAEELAQIVDRHGRPGAVVVVAGSAGELKELGAAVAAAYGSDGGVLVGLVNEADGELGSLTTELNRTGLRVNTVVGSSEGAAQLAALLAGPAADGLNGQLIAVSEPAGVPDQTGAVDEDAVVVVGMGLAVPGASSPEAFWELLCGSEPVFGGPGERLDLDTMWSADLAAEDRTYARVSGFMTGFEPHPRLRAELAEGRFDAEEFTALWLRHSFLQATEGVTVRPEDRQFFAVGLTPDGSQHLEQSLVTTGVRGLFAEAGVEVPPGLDKLYPLGGASPVDVLPYRIARMAVPELPDSAEIVVVDTACSSSLYTIDLGVRALRTGEADVALCGGAFALNAQSVVLFSKLKGLSRSGRVRALDKGADGVLFSDGAAVLALKTHARALADGDQILGFVAGFGASSDGRGKAIYAPNASGQQIALDRAWTAAEVTPEDVDWIVAHATGTPTGDRTEMTALAQSAGPGKTWTMTSNKSLVGHSGWAAGAVSAVHALLGLRHQTIPAQQQFDALPAGVPEGIRVPTADLPWPSAPERRRLVGVSAMGFGGTNGHLILADRPAPVPTPQRRKAVADDPVVVVAQGWHLPGGPDEESLTDWLAGAPAGWPATFGEEYPAPTPVEARLAPAALAAVDRSQLMAMRCADLLAGDWVRDKALAARTGVLVGHTGPTRSAIGYDLRCYLDDLTSKLTGPAGLPPELLADPIRAMVRPANEDSYPGLMPNIIAARVAQRLDLHGPNMTLDSGLDSVNSALATAFRYLRDGDLDLAVVMGVNAAARFVPSPDGREVAEGALGFVLTRRSIAEERGLPVLARLDLAGAGAGAAKADDATPPSPGDRTFRGAEGAVALLAALRSPALRTALRPAEDGHTPALVVTPERATDTTTDMTAAATTDTAAATVTDPDGLDSVLSRHTLTLRPAAARPVRPAVAAIPAGSLLLTDDPAALAGVELPDGCLLVAPGGAPRDPGARHAVRYLDDAADLARVIADSDRSYGQVRVLVQAPASTADTLALNDLAFVAAQSCATALEDEGCFAVLLLGAFEGGVPAPHVGVYGGLVRSLAQELTGTLVFAVVTSAQDAAAGLAELAEESALHRFVPLAYRAAGHRSELLLVPVEPGPADAVPTLPERPVILATGGARGLTAHLVGEVVAACEPRSVWLLGTSPATAPEPGAGPRVPRAEALRVLMARYPAENLAALSRRYDRSLQQAEREATVSELEKVCGVGNVHYRQCDVLDAGAVQQLVAEIHATEGQLDVVIHGAGLARSAVLARKKLTDYRTVRDVKVLGYANLRTALAGREPALWCSVSSVSAFTGLRGEPDYGAGNEFLLLAAARARAVEGRDEVALCSGLWVESGMASADTPGGAFLARQGEIGQLTDRQGREFFRRELAARGSHGLATTWIGEADWSTLQRRAPGFRAACLQAPAEPAQHTLPRSGPYAFLTTQPEQPAQLDGETVWAIDVDLDQHPYLRDHLVDLRPTVPGTFILEMAAEAACLLAPGLTPVRITDVTLSQFIRAPENRWPRRLHVIATREGDQVRVRITSPAAGPVPEREHTRMVVHLGRTLTPAPWCPAPPPGGTAAPNTYELPGTPVELGGVFSALQRPRLESDGGSAELRLTVPPEAGPFDRFVLPSITLDCLLRTVVLDGRHPEQVGVIVPTALGSIELHTTANDLALAEAGGEITLRHWYEPATGAEYCAAVAADGRALIRVGGISGAAKGTYDTRTKAWAKR